MANAVSPGSRIFSLICDFRTVAYLAIVVFPLVRFAMANENNQHPLQTVQVARNECIRLMKVACS
jgi:hypothetical protein